MKLICVFVFAYAKIQFSHDAAQITDEVIVNDIELLLHSKTSDKLNQFFSKNFLPQIFPNKPLR